MRPPLSPPPSGLHAEPDTGRFMGRMLRCHECYCSEMTSADTLFENRPNNDVCRSSSFMSAGQACTALNTGASRSRGTERETGTRDWGTRPGTQGGTAADKQSPGGTASGYDLGFGLSGSRLGGPGEGGERVCFDDCFYQYQKCHIKEIFS